MKVTESCSRHNYFIERTFRELNKYLNKYLENNGSFVNWQKFIPFAQYIHNATPKKALNGRSPSEIVYRFKPRTYADHISKLDDKIKSDYKLEKDRSEMNEFLKITEIIRDWSLQQYLKRASIMSPRHTVN